MEVTLIDAMGDDLTVVNAARVSFAKHINGDFSYEDGTPHIKEKDEKLVSYLATHNHWTPFSHCAATFRVKAPIFVARQLFKHKVGLTENEISRRYVDEAPEFYVPTEWRKKADNKKQGSSPELVMQLKHDEGHEDLWADFDNNHHPSLHVQCAMDHMKWLYDHLLESGICPEQARMVLPQAMYTQWYWTGSLAAWARVCNLRDQDDAQQETRIVAKKIAEHCARLWPVSWKALVRE